MMSIIVLLLCLFGTASAQSFTDPKSGVTYIQRTSAYTPYPDSIRVEFPEQKAVIVFQFKNVRKDLSLIKDFQPQFSTWITQIKSAITNGSGSRKVKIDVKENGEYKIRIEEPQAKVTQLAGNQT